MTGVAGASGTRDRKADRRNPEPGDGPRPHLTPSERAAPDRRGPPLIVPISGLTGDMERDVVEEEPRWILARYRRALGPDRRAALDAFEIVDVARKAVAGSAAWAHAGCLC